MVLHLDERLTNTRGTLRREANIVRGVFTGREGIVKRPFTAARRTAQNVITHAREFSKINRRLIRGVIH